MLAITPESFEGSEKEIKSSETFYDAGKLRRHFCEQSIIFLSSYWVIALVQLYSKGGISISPLACPYKQIILGDIFQGPSAWQNFQNAHGSASAHQKVQQCLKMSSHSVKQLEKQCQYMMNF